ncbi:hypothetical protein BDB00DRAFT_10034 [Zychaea mexicana]|uniref:uncharacterized protein n=1 Tax=Zychaea mexicana TaxID=64656 RepID=UPI0022FE0A89|nr:uncharacterized protein BDB00DRAFT_10034 [Zychaea mexicana]KAI9499629.1 hypothetical protein BDB00DRAFT_10034 [Zychaea mexicana]
MARKNLLLFSDPRNDGRAEDVLITTHEGFGRSDWMPNTSEGPNFEEDKPDLIPVSVVEQTGDAKAIAERKTLKLGPSEIKILEFKADATGGQYIEPALGAVLQGIYVMPTSWTDQKGTITTVAVSLSGESAQVEPGELIATITATEFPYQGIALQNGEEVVKHLGSLLYHPCPYLPIPAHTCPYLPIPARTCPYLPVPART